MITFNVHEQKKEQYIFHLILSTQGKLLQRKINESEKHAKLHLISISIFHALTGLLPDARKRRIALT